MPHHIPTPDPKREKEAAIFDAACLVIRRKGFYQARMADIAREAGISYGLVYHYFKSKNDLFEALIDEWWAGLDKLADRLAAETWPIEQKLKAVTVYFLDQYEQRPDLVHIFITEFSRSTANLTPDRLLRFKDFMARVEDIIGQAQQEGAIRRDLRARYLTFFFLGTLEALLSTMVLENQPLKNRAQKQRLTEAILNMFFEGARPSRS